MKKNGCKYSGKIKGGFIPIGNDVSLRDSSNHVETMLQCANLWLTRVLQLDKPASVAYRQLTCLTSDVQIRTHTGLRGFLLHALIGSHYAVVFVIIVQMYETGLLASCYGVFRPRLLPGGSGRQAGR